MTEYTFKHILSDIDKAVILAAWHCYAGNRSKYGETLIPLIIDWDILGNINLEFDAAALLPVLTGGRSS